MVKTMPLVEHIEELRTRLIVCVAALVFASVLAYPFTPELVKRVGEDLLPGVGEQIIVTRPMEAIQVRVGLALLLGFLFSSPVILYQAYAFLSPGLEEHEKKVLLRFLPWSILLFLFGGGFAYFVLLPLVFRFLVGVALPVARVMFTLGEVFSFVLLLVVAMGLIFQFPLVSYLLAKLGVVSPGFWASKRKHALVVSFLVGAIVTDPSVLTQVLAAVPIILVYEAGVLTSKLGWRERRGCPG